MDIPEQQSAQEQTAPQDRAGAADSQAAPDAPAQQVQPTAPEGPCVPIEQLVDLEALALASRGSHPPTKRALRAALPAGWVLAADGRSARRDLRVLARDGWVLLLGLVCFGSVALTMFWQNFPRGWEGITRLGILLLVVLVAGGLVAPLISKALNR